MLAKLTSNQLTLPDSVVDALGRPDHVEVELGEDGAVQLRAAEPLADIHAHIEALGITEQIIKDAIAWARRNPVPLDPMTRLSRNARRLRHQRRLVRTPVRGEAGLAEGGLG